MLELAILGLLKQQELHGYELKKRLTETLGFKGTSFGSLYPALGRLEAAGAVEVVETRGDLPPVPMTGSLGGELAAFRARKGPGRPNRGKKVYRITERGEGLFEELLLTDTQSSEDDRLFNLRLAFARYLPPAARLGLLERRRAHLADRLAHLGVKVRAGRDRLDGYARSLMEHDRETTEHDISWLDRLIASERATGSDGPPAPTVGTAAVAPVPGGVPATVAADSADPVQAPTISGFASPMAGPSPTPTPNRKDITT